MYHHPFGVRLALSPSKGGLLALLAPILKGSFDGPPYLRPDHLPTARPLLRRQPHLQNPRQCTNASPAKPPPTSPLRALFPAPHLHRLTPLLLRAPPTTCHPACPELRRDRSAAPFAARSGGIAAQSLYLTQSRHPERSGPIFSSAPPYGASGRAVEGSLCRFSLPLSFFSLCRAFTRPCRGVISFLLPDR